MRIVRVMSTISVAAMGLGLAACEPTPTVDLPASDLDVKITVGDFESNPSDGKVLMAVQFFNQGRYVQLATNATVSCNGVTLPMNSGLGYMERVPIVAPAGQYTFVHTRGGTNAQVPVTVPSRPVITSPAANATVGRTSNLTISYATAGGTTVKGTAYDASTSRGGSDQPDTGTYTGLDVTALSAGPGFIKLTRELAMTPPGNDFHSATVKYTTGSVKRPVTWN